MAPSLPPIPPSPSGTSSFAYKRFLPVAIILGLIGLVYAMGWQKYLSLDTLKTHHVLLNQYVQSSLVGSLVVFGLVYITVVVLSLPGATVMTMTGGYLFGQWIGTSVAIISATVGATCLFLTARYVLGDFLKSKAAPWFQRFQKGFQKNAFSYLLTLRLIPLFPFFVINLVPAFLGVPLVTYIFATAIGIIPGTFIYVSLGVGLGSVFDKLAEEGGELTLKSLTTPEMILGLLGLALLSLLPIAYRYLKHKKRG